MRTPAQYAEFINGETAMRNLPKQFGLGIVSVLTIGFASLAWGGSFIASLDLADSKTIRNQSFIMHPQGYTGVATALTINLCIVPDIPAGTNIHAAAMVKSVNHIAAIMTAKAGKTGNLGVGATGDAVPGTDVDFESVALEKWPANTKYKPHSHFGGEEIYVLSGTLMDEWGSYPAGTWIRSPHNSEHCPYVQDETVVWIKTGHLPSDTRK